MRSVSIVGIGQSPVGELWERSIREIAYDAVMAAMRDANIETADALFVGNMLSGSLLNQEHLATLIADTCGLYGIEAAKIEAACGSAAAALRVGTMAIASGTGTPECTARLPMTSAETTRIAPTERSIPAVRMMSVWAIATMPITVTCSSTRLRT